MAIFDYTNNFDVIRNLILKLKVERELDFVTLLAQFTRNLLAIAEFLVIIWLPVGYIRDCDTPNVLCWQIAP